MIHPVLRLKMKLVDTFSLVLVFLGTEFVQIGQAGEAIGQFVSCFISKHWFYVFYSFGTKLISLHNFLNVTL